MVLEVLAHRREIQAHVDARITEYVTPAGGFVRDSVAPGAMEACVARLGAVVETDEVEDARLRRDQEVLERLREICATLEGSEEGVLQDRPLFRVGRRRFAIFNGEYSPARSRWAGAGRSIHFLSDPFEREALLQDTRFTRSPHHGDRGWLAIRVDSDTVDWAELAELLAAAHAQVASRR